MAVYGAFSSSMLGMMSQSHSLQNIGLNIANVNTGGYRRVDTQFATVLSSQTQHLHDLGGVRPTTSQRIDQQGIVTSTGRQLDAAINGNGFFMLNTELDGSGETFYTRDGSFKTVAGADIQVTADDGVTQITTQESFLTDKNGYYVMGWSPQPDGSFRTTGSVSALRVDPYAFSSSGVGTTYASFVANLPADDPSLSTHRYNMQTYDGNGNARVITMNYTKDPNNTGADNTWAITPQWSGAKGAQVDRVTLGGSIEAGDKYQVTVGSTTVSYTVTGAEAGMRDVQQALIAQINSNPTISGQVTASASGPGRITLTADTPGTAFTTTAQTIQGPASVAQINGVSLAGVVTPGDNYTVTLNGIPFTVNAGALDTLATIGTKLQAQINADPAYTTTATGVGTFDISATGAGIPFTIASATTSGSATIADALDTPNYTALSDNTATTTTVTANNDGNYSAPPVRLRFNNDGTLRSPPSTNIDINFGGGPGNRVAFRFNLTGMTQYAGDFSPYNFSQNGYGSGQLSDVSFNEQGRLVGQFTNAINRPVYQLALASFSNPNGLEMMSGNLFREAPDSGPATLFTAAETGTASIAPNSRELSNVNLEHEFTNMITTQTAYNSSSTVFRTVDEMLTTARDLKR